MFILVRNASQCSSLVSIQVKNRVFSSSVQCFVTSPSADAFFSWSFSAVVVLSWFMNSNMVLYAPVAAAYEMDMAVSPHDPRPYALSQRPLAPPVPGPLPSPNFQSGNPFAPAPSSAGSSGGNSASNTPPHGASPPMLALPRRASAGGASDADTEESSSGPLSRFGSIASVGAGSEMSWTSAFTSDGGHVDPEEANVCASRRESW